MTDNGAAALPVYHELKAVLSEGILQGRLMPGRPSMADFDWPLLQGDQRLSIPSYIGNRLSMSSAVYPDNGWRMLKSRASIVSQSVNARPVGPVIVAPQLTRHAEDRSPVRLICLEPSARLSVSSAPATRDIILLS